MVRKPEVLVLSFLVLACLASGSQVSVEVGEEVQIRHYEAQYKPSTSSMNQINLTAENLGSSNCIHSLKAEIQANQTSRTRYSTPVELEAGESLPVAISLLPLNHTGEVDVSLYSTGCDRTIPVTNLSYNLTQRHVAGDTYRSETLDSNPRSISFEVENVTNATLVPVEKPAVWKVGATELRLGGASPRIKPTIYKPSFNITYAVVQNGTVLGETEVRLQEQEELREQILDMLVRPRIVIVSIALNFLLVVAVAALNRQSLKRALAKIR